METHNCMTMCNLSSCMSSLSVLIKKRLVENRGSGESTPDVDRMITSPANPNMLILDTSA